MDIAGLPVRCAIQKNETIVDRFGNHAPAWTDFFSCWASAKNSGQRVEETEEAGYTQEAGRMEFTVRWSPETAAVNTKEYRILFNGHIYNIISIDEMGFNRNSRKFFCQMSER